MTDEQKRQMIEHFTQVVCEQPEARIVALRPAKRMKPEPGEQWERHEPGPCTYLVIATGPERDVEKEIVDLLDRSGNA